MAVTFLTNEDKEDLQENINQLSAEIANLKENGTGTGGNSSGGTTTTTEIVSIEYEEYVGNLLLTNGNTKTAENRVASDKISAVEGEVYLLTCSANWGNPIYVICDSSDAVIGSEVSPATSAGLVVSDYEVIMPEGTSYFRVACNLDIQPNGTSVSKKVTTTTGTSENTTDLKWSGKTWLVIGDSITEKNIRTAKHYYDYIAEKTGITVRIAGVGGTGYLNGKDTNTAFYQRITEELLGGVDVITIFGSGNDRNLTLGSINDGTATDPTTVCGAFIRTISNIYDIKPLANIGIITPTPWKEHRPNDDTSTMTLYSNKIVELCQKSGLPYLDLYRCSGLRPWNETFRELAYSKDDGDGTHPDETGHAIIAPKIKAFLETLLM